MENINQIKLNIWGIRGGFRSFCHSEDLNIEESEIKNTWKDIRDFVYVSDLSVRFYALEFTATYKVFTIYRPVNDTSRTGAYVATTIYVPHGLNVNHILDLLQQISDAYHKDHYDAFGNPNANPDYVQIYTDIIKNYAPNVDRESKKRMWSASAQDNTPKILPYNDNSVVEKFFAEPYRKEFLSCQEVMFWENVILGNTQMYGVKFQKTESINDENCFTLNGVDIKGQFNGGQIRNQPSGYVIDGFMLDGKDITNSWTSALFDDTDEIEVKMSKPYHETKTYRGTMMGAGSPFVKFGTDYEFGSVYFNPRKYSARIIVPADVAKEDFDLYVNNNPISIESGQGNLSFYGDEIDSIRKIKLHYGNASFPVMELKLKDLFPNGNDAPETILSVKVDNLKKIGFEFDRPCSGKVSINGQEMSFDANHNSRCAFVLPADLRTDANSFAFDVDELDAKVEAKNPTTFKVILTSKYFYAGISFEQGLENYIDYNCFKLKIKGDTYYSSYGIKFKLPQNEKASVKNKDGVLGVVVSNGQLTVPCSYDIMQGNGECEILMKPQLALYYNETGAVVTLNSEKGASVRITANGRVVLPALKWIVKDSKGDKDGCEISEETYNGCRQFTIRQKEVASTKGSVFEVNNSQGTSSYGYAPSGTTNTPPTYGGSSYGSSGYGEGKQNRSKNDYLCYYYNDGGQPFALNGASSIFRDYKCYTIKDLEMDRHLVLCYHLDNTPFLEKTKEICTQNNNIYGFEVGLNGEGFYAVKDVMGKGGKKGNRASNEGRDDDGKSKKKWIILGCLAGVLLLAVAGLLIWKPWARKKAECYVQIEMTHGTNIENVALIPETELVKGSPSSETTYKIALFTDWKELSLQVQTKGEGSRDIKLREKGEGKIPVVEPTNIKKSWSTNTLTITLDSPAWEELEKIVKDKGATIENYADIVKEYESSSVRNECSEKAYVLLGDFSDTTRLLAYIKYFKDIDKDKAKICNDLLVSIRERKKAEQDLANQKQQNLDDFTKELKTVYSINCTKEAVDRLKGAYGKVKGYERSEINEVMRGVGLAPLDDGAFNGFIEAQKKFFTIFDEAQLDKAQATVDDLTGQMTSKFTSDQRNLMKIVTKNTFYFRWYINNQGECKNGQFYKYIRDYEQEVEEARIEAEK